MIVKKKVLPEYFKEVKNGNKTFELRLSDWQIKEGDTLELKEYDPYTQSYTGREITKKVGFVIKTKEIKFWKPEEVDKYGYQVISLLD